MDKRRTLVQIIFTLVSNGYYYGFAAGKIFQGPSKNLCLPGLNCYSCPGALGACPIGALQAVAGDRNHWVSYYAAGFLIFVGALGGRMVCGWLCPFGLFQDLLHKIPVPGKIRNVPWGKYLGWIKYAFLVLFVLLLPAVWNNEFGQGDPWFCKWICPSGTLMAGWPLAASVPALRSSLGFLFGWKSLVLIGLIALSMWVYRPFCRWMCPLGAIYGALNGISLMRIHYDEARCIHCGLCAESCKLNLHPESKPNGSQCIRCGACLKACPTGALTGFMPKTHQEREPEKAL